jgi:serine/threonine protein kinase
MPAFRRLAIASGLLTADQLLTADARLRAKDRRIGVLDEVTDEQLAAELINEGLLNAWQVEQLKVGRSKFNLGPYQVIDSIGKGGMGQVFKGVHTMMGRVVAIKVLPRHKSTPEAVACFTREIRAQAQLDHPNLVRAFDAGLDGNVYFLVCEYVPGTDLRKLVRVRGRLSMTDAATIISQAAKGLAHAHSRGLIHRDIKPGNLLVTPEGLTKVSDLGLAGFLGEIEDKDRDPRAGKIVGTADYLAPEQVLTPDKVSPASDIYSLGVTLYYAVTGKVPFAGGTAREKARRHVEDAPLNPRRLNAELSEEFVAVMAAMMEKDQAGRIQTAAEVIQRLSPWASATFHTAEDEVARQAFTPNLGHAPVPSPLDATSGFFGDPVEPGDESPSQISQGTDPVNAALEETVPEYLQRRAQRKRHSRSSLLLVMVVLVPLLLAALMLVTIVVLKVFK